MGLKEYGYQNVVMLSQRKRRVALKEAAKHHSRAQILYWLSRLKVFTSKKSPNQSRIYAEDYEYVKHMRINI